METVRLMGTSEPCFPRWWQREEGAASRATQPDCDVCQVAGLPLPLCCVPNMAVKKMPLYFGLWFPEHSPYLAVSCVGEREFSVSAQHPAWPPSSDSSPGQAPSCCLPPLASPPFQTRSAGSPGAMSVLRDKGNVRQRGKNQNFKSDKSIGCSSATCRDVARFAHCCISNDGSS